MYEYIADLDFAFIQNGSIFLFLCIHRNSTINWLSLKKWHVFSNKSICSPSMVITYFIITWLQFFILRWNVLLWIKSFLPRQVWKRVTKYIKMSTFSWYFHWCDYHMAINVRFSFVSHSLNPNLFLYVMYVRHKNMDVSCPMAHLKRRYPPKNICHEHA